MEGRWLFMCSRLERGSSSRATTLDRAPAAIILSLTAFFGRHVAARASMARSRATSPTRKAFGYWLAGYLGNLTNDMGQELTDFNHRVA